MSGGTEGHAEDIMEYDENEERRRGRVTVQYRTEPYGTVQLAAYCLLYVRVAGLRVPVLSSFLELDVQ